MPSLEEMRMVGESCSQYEPVDDNLERSCGSCQHWGARMKCVNWISSSTNSPVWIKLRMLVKILVSV